MISRAARQFWTFIANSPRQFELPLDMRRRAGERAEGMTAEPRGVAFLPALERLSTEWNHSVDKKSLQIQKLEHILADRIDPVRSEYALEAAGLWAEPPEAREGAAILYFHGGGYVLGSPKSRRKTAGHLALACAARTLVPFYRVGPEHPFPAAVEDGIRALQFLFAQGADPARTIIAGDSAGGGLALAVALFARDKGLPDCAGLALISPWTDLTCSGASFEDRAGADITCARKSLLEMAGWYLGGADPLNPLASPLFADLSGLPPVLALVGGDEVLLDDTLRLVRKAAIAGVDATAVVAAGMQHVYPIWAGVFPEADEAIAQIGDWALGKTASG